MATILSQKPEFCPVSIFRPTQGIEFGNIILPAAARRNHQACPADRMAVMTLALEPPMA
jgi:hypothetical protein